MASTDDGHPIYVFLISDPTKYSQYFELTIRAINFLKKSVKGANIGIIYPPETENLETTVKDRLKEINPKVDVENIYPTEGHKHFDDWDNTQYILDIEGFTEEFDPIIFLDSDSVVLLDVSSVVHDFIQSGKKFGFSNSYVSEYPTFDKNWKGLKFIPSTTFQIYKTSAFVEILSNWKNHWKTWIEPAPFVRNKDPARFFLDSKITIGQYALAQTLFEYSQNFSADVFEIPRHFLKVVRNFSIEPQKNKRKFLGDGSSFSNDGPMKLTLKVKSAKLDESSDTSVVVSVGDREKDTQIIQDTNEPVWDEELVFEDTTYAASNEILFTLYNHPKPPPPVKARSFGGPYVGVAQVTLEIVSGHIVNKHDITGEDDPYVKVKIGTVEKETKHLENTNNPQWNETLTFDDVVSDDAQAITITVWDWDRFTKHDLVGTATLNLLPYNGNKQHVTVTVEDKGKEEATIEIDVLLTPAESNSTTAPVATRSFSDAGAEGGGGEGEGETAAPTKEVIGTARLSLLDKKTHTAGDPGPVSFTLDVIGSSGSGSGDGDGQQQEEKKRGTLEIDGEFLVELLPEDTAAAATATTTTTTRDFPGGGGGDNDALSRSFANAVATVDTYSPPWEGPAEVTLNVLSGVILGNSQDVLGKGDPYVKVKIAAVEKQTKHLGNTKTPAWNEKLVFTNVQSADGSGITITVWDYDKITKHDLIGTAKLNLLPYNKNKQHITVSALDEQNKEQAKIEIEVLVTPKG